MDFGDYRSHFVLRAEVSVNDANETAIVVTFDLQLVGTTVTPGGLAISLVAGGLGASAGGWSGHGYWVLFGFCYLRSPVFLLLY